MIVYYTPHNLMITGISYKVNPGQPSSYIVTDELLAEDIFLGKEKSSNYRVLVRDAENHIGFIKKSGQSSKGATIDEKFYLIPFKNSSAEVIIVQDTDKKTISIKLSEVAGEWWKDEKVKHDTIAFYACEPFDLYKPLWMITVSPEELANSIDFQYQGKDTFCLFTKKIFESYTHDCT